MQVSYVSLAITNYNNVAQAINTEEYHEKQNKTSIITTTQNKTKLYTYISIIVARFYDMIRHSCLSFNILSTRYTDVRCQLPLLMQPIKLYALFVWTV